MGKQGTIMAQKKRGRTKGKHGGMQQPRRMRQNPHRNRGAFQRSLGAERGREMVAGILVDHPRLGLTLHILISSMIGGALVGLLIASAIYGFATVTKDPLWVYAFGILVALLLKIVGQWIWLVVLRPLLPGYIRPVMARVGLPNYNNGNVSIEQSSQISILVAVVVATAIATMIATENVTPGWIASGLGKFVAPAIGGAIAGSLEAVSAPSNLYALWYNRNPYEEQLGGPRAR